MGLASVLLGLALLMYLAYRGVSVLVLAPALAAATALAAGQPVLGSYTQVFMVAAGGFVMAFFPLFLLGAIFGKLMDASGSAQAIARWAVARLGRDQAILAVVLACAILTYGGVSLFVVAFAVYPIAAALFREADVPARLMPGAIALGAFTFTMTALPGTPAIQNAIPMPFFGTTPFAAPGLGVIAGLVMAGLGLGWLGWRAAAARSRGEGFGRSLPTPEDIPLKRVREQSQGEGFDVMELPASDARRERPLPGIVVALAPILIVVGLNYLFAELLLPRLDLSYLRTPAFGETDPQAVIGVWAIISALVLSSLAVVALNWSRIARTAQVISDGANASVAPIFNTASLVGFGAVIASLPAFEALRDAILGIAPGNPLVSLSIAVNVLAGITGSASGGMSIALETLGARYLELGLAAGIDPEVLHRVTAVATGGLDALPHNGAVVTLLTICGLTHRESYLDIFMVAVAGPLAALVTLVVLATVFGAF